MSTSDYQRMERLAAVMSLVGEHAQAWQAVGQSEGSSFDPGLKYKKKEALEATQALKDAILSLQDQPTGAV